MICRYCEKEAEWVENKEIYGRNYGKSYMIWLCRDCNAYVGCHKNSKRPLGKLANAELREYRKKSKELFIAKKMNGNWNNKKLKKSAYQFLNDIFGKEFHFGESTIEECKKRGISGISRSIQDLQEYFTDEYEIVTEPPIPYKAGDLVDILPIAKELPDFKNWLNSKKEMVGQKGLEVEDYSGCGTYGFITKDVIYKHLFPHWCLAPHFQEEVDKIKEAMELLKKKGYKVIKE